MTSRDALYIRAYRVFTVINLGCFIVSLSVRSMGWAALNVVSLVLCEAAIHGIKKRNNVP